MPIYFLFFDWQRSRIRQSTVLS